MSKTTISEFQFLKQFNTEEKAVQFFEAARWSEGRYCPYCGSFRTYPHKTRKFYYHCREKACRKQFSCKANTVMQSSKLPVRMWLYTMYKFSVARKGIPSLQLAKELGITQKSAWFICAKTVGRVTSLQRVGIGRITFQEILQEVAESQFKSRVVTGDVLRVLRDQSIDIKFDVVIADPPYNIGKDFGTTDDNMPLSDYIEWTQKWLSRCFMLLSENGLIYIYGFAEILSRISALCPAEEQRWLVWHYRNKAVPSLKFWQRSHESILCLWKPGTERPKLEVDQIREPYTQSFLNNAAGKVRRATKSRFGGNRGKETEYKAHEKGALPRDVIKIPALAGGAGASERWFMCHDCENKIFPPGQLKQHRNHNTLKHPTQKPMRLTKKLIESRINGNNGRVLIPFVGSGSECVVAKQMGVEFLGIEINPLYSDFARKWLKCTN